MYRSIVALAAGLVGCAAPPEDTLTTAAQELGTVELTREPVAGDVVHYRFVVPVGSGPNAALVVHRVVRERAPGVPRRSAAALMMMHGDFATFATNFLPGPHGMAAWLAERGIDVWGVDRRWTRAPEGDADLSDFDAMGLDQELDDVGAALALARAIRVVTDGSAERLHLAGFSRGGQLAYFYASREAARPPLLRHVKGLVPIDVYASLAPEDEALRQFACGNAAWARDQLAAGIVDVPNDLQLTTGRLALADPGGQSPFFPFPVTNREWFLSFVGETYYYYPASPRYHLNAPILDEDTFVIGLRAAAEDDVAAWLAGAAPHQSMRESLDTDALVCGDAPLPADLPLARIRVPLFLLAAAGGYGAHALYSTTQVGSTDVTALVVQQLPAERVAEDFGHADLLYSPDAPAQAWQPLVAWLRAH